MRGMWLCMALAIALLTAGCKEEPTFDERYAQTQKRIGDKSRELDRNLAQTAPASPSDGSDAPN
ncbi:hypothetical protein [Porphyrobacter sp. GA68]|uniref:hypothetical protein n=1 Tax=Porphyrobacter sp. GA68 TaxID=2883480 RepID=UPI001D183BCB|nr:hypothetical protein [Porphyrobacter sp. GA68]